VAAPVLLLTLKDRYEEAWLGSAAVADLDGDGAMEIVVPRGEQLLVWSASGEVKVKFATNNGRIWASPVVADLRPEPGLEIAFAAGDKVFLLDATGKVFPGFPVQWVKELRSLAAADVDGDGQLDLVVAPADGGQAGDVMLGWRTDGTPLAGFPPNKSGSSGCDAKCYVAGCYDQNVALGDLDGDGKADVVVGHDNAYASFHKGTGEAFDANPIFPAKKTPGVRYLHDLALAKQGYADDEATALQAHFTNTAPAIADIDGDGVLDIVLLGSVQNAAQDMRELGVGLWVLHRDASRLDAWQEPFHAPDYLAGLWDYDGTNIVAATNQVTVADIDPAPGLEMIFAGFDGKIHCVSAARQELWATTYTTDPQVLTGGVVVADLSGDGAPEIIFNSYSTDMDKGALFILGSKGNLLHQVALPRRGAMPVPTVADVDGDGALDIVVSLKDAEDKVESVRVYRVPGSAPNCVLWPTGRGNLLRNGLVK
jgi:outer membrane protein assembly factor BamB